MDDVYVQGFMDKCAAAGVDPEALIKEAGMSAAFSKLGPKLMALLSKGKGAAKGVARTGKKVVGNLTGSRATEFARRAGIPEIGTYGIGGRSFRGKPGKKLDALQKLLDASSNTRNTAGMLGGGAMAGGAALGAGHLLANATKDTGFGKGIDRINERLYGYERDPEHFLGWSRKG